MNTISTNQFLSKINFKQVTFIESVSSDDELGNVLKGESILTSAIHFIDSTTLLTAQPLNYFRVLAHGRMLDVPSTDFKTGLETKRLVPLDAVHHLERVREQDGGKRNSREPAEALIVYRAYDPECPSQHFQMPVAVSLIDDLLVRDAGGLIDIGGGKFVFADEVENARPIEAKNIARLAQCEDRGEGPDKPPVSIIELSDGAFIPSPFPAQTVEGMVGRPLPSACLSCLRYEAGISP
jgi:hypothetical protein